MEVETPVLTSTTAPGKIFASRAELAEHYKSKWHQYNLKRREAGLPPLLESDFQARLAAAQEALEQQQKGKQTDSHLKKGKEHRRNKKNKQQQQKQKVGEGSSATISSQAPAYDRIKQQQQQQDENGSSEENPATKSEDGNEKSEEDKMVEAAQQIEIDPRQCLFDRHVSATVEDNVDRMQRKYGFFLPDREYLTDLEGLVGYCHEKIKIGRVCLYCQKGFATWEGCQKHMVQKRHCKLRYEPNIDLEEYTIFYDFQSANEEFMVSRGGRIAAAGGVVAKTDENDNNDDDDDDDDEWEDISDDEGEGADDDAVMGEVDNEAGDDDEMYANYERDVAAMGLDVTPLGELVFPDGRIIGHRAFRRYYKQRAPRTTDNRASVAAARHAAGDRIYQGRIVNLHDAQSSSGGAASNALMAQQAGIKPSLLAGGVGKGILVSSGSSGSFTQVSVYRYRAALRKQRRDDAKGDRLHARSNMNINRMDKKHNRLMNGVSVAHAAR